MLDEVASTISKLQSRQDVIKRDNTLLENLFEKVKNSLKIILQNELGLDLLYQSYLESYPSANYENTIKLYLRYRLILQARNQIGLILGALEPRQELLAEMRNLLKKSETDTNSDFVIPKLVEQGNQLVQATGRICTWIH